MTDSKTSKIFPIKTFWNEKNEIWLMWSLFFHIPLYSDVCCHFITGAGYYIFGPSSTEILTYIIVWIPLFLSKIHQIWLIDVYPKTSVSKCQDKVIFSYRTLNQSICWFSPEFTKLSEKVIWEHFQYMAKGEKGPYWCN